MGDMHSLPRPPVVRPSYLRELVASTDDVVRGDLDDLAALVARGGVVALSGAGLSTESGIPDYRGPQGALRRHTPMTYQEFVGSAAGRRRYWARSFMGWRHVAKARANAGHRAVAELERMGLVDCVITQNVDGLHREAGSRVLHELHGTLSTVVCLSCGRRSPRLDLDDRLRAANPGFEEHVRGVVAALVESGQVNPDGDIDLPERALDAFELVTCRACGQDALKPDVVFFGESVPRDRVDACLAAVDRADTLLVLGSSLTVMSGFRFVLRASERGICVAIVNQGPTRGDDRATIRLEAALGESLTELVRKVG